ncbi:MAG: MATE family efflux transporter [Solobacterium sp.]|nr:MATE family efflux transporter [Solobacterium sp.]
MHSGNFTEGKIFEPLIRFTLPVMFALFLQSLYGAVDLLVVGRYASNADVSAVSTGAQLMQTMMALFAGLAMGTTILLGQQIGEGREKEAGRTVGGAIVFFALLGIVLSITMLGSVPFLARLMNAPAEAFDATCRYIRICSGGLLFIIAYNLLGALFRGIGNSRLPLFSVAVAAVINIFGDLLLVRGFHMGAAGAAFATVCSQGISVLISLLFLRRVDMPFSFSRQDIRYHGDVTSKTLHFGVPVALMDLLVGISFLVLLSIVNSLGLLVSAGVGVAEKVCGFILLIPSSFGQSMASFTAQNYGAGKMDRAYKGLQYGIVTGLGFGLVLFWLSFFHGDLLCRIFSNDPQVIQLGWDYLKAYAIDCILTAVFFSMTGFFNGCGFTKFVMIQGIIGAFLVRIPIAWLMSKQVPVSLFHIGLATPASSLVQCILCFGYLFLVHKQLDRKKS